MEALQRKVFIELFPQLEPSLLEQILAICTIRSLEEGQEVLRTGQYIRSSVLVLSGLLKVCREDEEGNEFLMYYLEPGSACALSMMCTARDEKSPIMARAVESSEIVLVPAHQSEPWLAQYKSWQNFVISAYRQRFEELLLTLDSVAFKGLDERLLFYLKRHVKVGGREIKLSHQQIAYELNSSREVISRLLKKLEQAGAVTLHRNSIEVHRLEMV